MDCRIEQNTPQTEGTAHLAAETTSGRYFRPQVDILQQADAVVILADVPGATADGVEVTFEKGVLTFTAEIAKRTPESGFRAIHREYEIGAYQRSFEVREQIDVTKIGAELSRGVLKLTLPKSEKAQPQRIVVKGA